jgi:hypothetical protein
MAEGDAEYINKLVGASEQEKRKNRILLSIFVAGIIGFVVLVYNRPAMNHAEVLEEISFPPTAQQLYKLSRVRLSLDRSYWSTRMSIRSTRQPCSSTSTRSCRPSPSLDPSSSASLRPRCSEHTRAIFCPFQYT